MEALMYGGTRLSIHLALIFNLFIKTGYLPKPFMQALIIPLVKSKSGGDLTDANNYRTIAVSTAISKLFESIAAEFYHNGSTLQISTSFKSGHSTGLCTSILKRTINYYINRGSHIFLCSVDFSKAFDRVNYWKLFNMLLDDGISAAMVHLLAFWYSNQEMCVSWNSVISAGSFALANGTRQGGVLSPYLFSRYIRGMIDRITKCSIGCNIGVLSVNILAYADDIVLLSPSWTVIN